MADLIGAGNRVAGKKRPSPALILGLAFRIKSLERAEGCGRVGHSRGKKLAARIAESIVADEFGGVEQGRETVGVDNAGIAVADRRGRHSKLRKKLGSVRENYAPDIETGQSGLSGERMRDGKGHVKAERCRLEAFHFEAFCAGEILEKSANIHVKGRLSEGDNYYRRGRFGIDRDFIKPPEAASDRVSDRTWIVRLQIRLYRARRNSGHGAFGMRASYYCSQGKNQGDRMNTGSKNMSLMSRGHTNQTHPS